MLHRCLRTVAVLLTALVAVSLLGPVTGQDDSPEPAGELNLAFSGDDSTANVTEDIAPGTVLKVLKTDGSGSGTTPSGCQGPSGGGVSIAWISDPVFENPYNVSATPIGNLSVPIEIASPNQAPATATGGVTMNLRYGWIAPGAGLHEHALGQEAQSPARGTGLPAGPSPITGPVTFDLDYAGNAAPVPAGSLLVFILDVECDATASFAVGYGAVGPLQYVWGTPGAPDADGDGFPDDVDQDMDDDTFSNAEELAVGSDPRDAGMTPQSESANCPGYTYQDVFDETGDPNQCPVEGGFPWLLILLVLLVVILLAGGGAGAFLVVNKKIKMTVSHDGFQSVDKGQSAEYELTLMATGKKEEEVPVELTLKGVPEDWSASLEPSHMTLFAGEAAEAQTAVLRLTPPPGEEYESEAQVVVTATPTDAEGKTSAMKPGTSVKTKTIVNIGVTPPEGEKKKKPKKEKAPTEEGAAETEEGGKKKLAMGGLLKRKKKEEGEGETEAEAEEKTAETASEPPAAGAAAAEPAPTSGKPSVAMGKMVHEPSDFNAGDDVTTTVTVRNKGDGPVEGLTLSLYVNDQRADQKSIDLGPGDAEDVTFRWTAQPDENRVKLKGSMKGA